MLHQRRDQPSAKRPTAASWGTRFTLAISLDFSDCQAPVKRARATSGPQRGRDEARQTGRGREDRSGATGLRRAARWERGPRLPASPVGPNAGRARPETVFDMQEST